MYIISENTEHISANIYSGISIDNSGFTLLFKKVLDNINSSNCLINSDITIAM